MPIEVFKADVYDVENHKTLNTDTVKIEFKDRKEMEAWRCVQALKWGGELKLKIELMLSYIERP